MAREVLARQGLAADVRLDRWEPSRQARVPPGDTAAAGLPPEQEGDPGSRRLRTVGALIVAIIEGIGSALSPGQPRRSSAPGDYRPAGWRAIEGCRNGDPVACRDLRARPPGMQWPQQNNQLCA